MYYWILRHLSSFTNIVAPKTCDSIKQDCASTMHNHRNPLQVSPHTGKRLWGGFSQNFVTSLPLTFTVIKVDFVKGTASALAAYSSPFSVFLITKMVPGVQSWTSAVTHQSHTLYFTTAGSCCQIFKMQK